MMPDAQMIEAARLTVPLLPAIAAAGGTLAFLVGIVVWALHTFERREDANRKHDAHDERFRNIEPVMGKIRDDVSYIRGRLEPKG